MAAEAVTKGNTIDVSLERVTGAAATAAAGLSGAASGDGGTAAAAASFAFLALASAAHFANVSGEGVLGAMTKFSGIVVLVIRPSSIALNGSGT